MKINYLTRLELLSLIVSVKGLEKRRNIIKNNWDKIQLIQKEKLKIYYNI